MPIRLYELGRNTPRVLRQSLGEDSDLTASGTGNGNGRLGIINAPDLTQDTQTVNDNQVRELVNKHIKFVLYSILEFLMINIF